MSAKKPLHVYIDRAITKHNGKYSYARATEIKTIADKITITCPIHGDFEQSLQDHMKGHGCRLCGNMNSHNIKTKTTKEILIAKSKILYGDKYDFSKTIIGKNNKEKVLVTCKDHGDFYVTPNNHMRGSAGCPNCKHRKFSEKGKLWSYSEWEQTGKRSKQFRGYTLYIIKCYGNNEEFYKIGKTYTTIERRFHTKELMPYSYNIVYSFKSSAKEISELEKMFHKQFKEYKYTPLLSFGGRYECFANLNKKELLSWTL